MPTVVVCPNCRARVKVPTGMEGSWLRCPGCPARFPADAGTLPRGTAARAEGQRSTSLTDLAVVDATGRRPRADAARLVAEPEPERRPLLAGDARRKSRRCDACSGHVPVGMSICPFCGMDQETGMLVAGRIGLRPEEEAERERMPWGVGILGGVVMLASLFLATALVIRPDVFGWWLMPPLAVLALSGLYGGIQFVRGFQVRMLVFALLLAAVLDLALVFLIPAFGGGLASGGEAARIRLFAGAGGLVGLVLAGIYLSSWRVRRFFALRRGEFVAPENDDDWVGFTTTT